MIDCALDIHEKLKDLRTNRRLTLQDVSDATGISTSALGAYEKNEGKDISLANLKILKKYYGVSYDFLLCDRSVSKEHDTPIDDLRLTDDAIRVLKSGSFNGQLLSEIITHPGFQQLMLDAEIYVDRHIENRIKDLNMLMEHTRQQIIDKLGREPRDLYMRTLQAGQIEDTEHLQYTLKTDLMSILSTIREAHRDDSYTADQSTSEILQDVIPDIASYSDRESDFQGCHDDLILSQFLKGLGIRMTKLSKSQQKTMIDVLKMSRQYPAMKVQKKKKGA